MLGFGKGFVICVGIMAFAVSGAHAKSYLFRVSCGHETFVAQWESGPVDPGIYHFRNATGDTNLDCLVYDYDARTDEDLPRRWCRDPGPAIELFPPILILSSIPRCR